MTPFPPASSPEAASLDELPTIGPEGQPSPTPKRPRPSLGWLAYAAVCLFWGTSGPLIRFTVRHVPALWLVTIRFFIAGGLLWLVLWLRGRRPPLRGLVKLLPVGLTLAFTNVLVTLGFQRVEAGSGALLLATTAVTFAVVDVCWPGGTSKPSRSVWLGLLLGLLGVAVLVISPGMFGGGTWQGYLMLEISAWTWALGSVAQARQPSGLDPLQSSSWQMLLAAVAVWPIAMFVGGAQLGSITVDGWLGVLALVVTASLIGFVSFVYMLHELPAYVVGSYTYVNAIVAALVSVLWLGEQLSIRYFASALLVLGGVTLIQWRLVPNTSSAK